MKDTIVLELDGRFLYYAFMAGGKRILQNQAEINRINVFPVKDMDTGTNLASTVRSVMDSIKPNKSYNHTFTQIAEAALVGARGNSGIIFAQFLYGMSREVKNKQLITLSEFIESTKKSIPYIYEAIANPVEGTMLTVIKEWSDFLESNKASLHDFKKAIVDSLVVLEKSLKGTTAKLKVLSQHNFVDAGAKGFVLFIEGIVDLIKNQNIRQLSHQTSEPITLIHTDDISNEKLNFRYCTEALLKNISQSKSELQQLLSRSGDSVVVAGSDDICRIHVHTNHPASLFHQLKDIGTISYQKVDDMVRQQEVLIHRKWNIALVTDSTCDLSQELIEFYQINMLPINLNFGDNHYLDKVTIQPEQFYELLESSRDFPKTSMVNERAFANLYSHLASHYDAIIAIHLTGQFSGTYTSSQKAAKRIQDEFKKPVHVFDSKNLSGALGLLVLRTAYAIEAGKPLQEIVEKVNSWIPRSKIFVSVKDLKYMIKGGRVSKPKGFVANALGLNPIVSMDADGKSMLFGNTFNQRSSLNKITKQIVKLSKRNTVWNYIILHANNLEEAEKTKQQMIQVTQKQPISIVNISPVIGMHAGVGAVAISLLYDD